MTSTAAQIREQLFATRSGVEVNALLNQLLQEHADDAPAVLMDYAQRGSVKHMRTHAVARLADLATPGDMGLAVFFERSLQDPLLEYWSVRGLLTTSGAACFPTLTALALDAGREREVRAHAIRIMGLASGQHFILGLPTDPGHWKEAELPLQALSAWAAAGFPQGAGFAPPRRSARLLDPQSALDRAAAALEERLARERARYQDPVNPTQWLVPASPSDLAAIQVRWTLPAIYLEFLQEFSPLRVYLDLEDYPLGLSLYGASELIRLQSGYSYDHVQGRAIPSWPENFIVIAGHDSDPVVLDLGRIADGDAPVLMAEHGTGSWDFSAVAPTFLAFISRIATSGDR